MASLRRAKKQAKKEGRLFIDPTKKRSYTDKEILEKSAKIKAEAANRRLKALNKSGNYGTFSSKKLFDRLDSPKLKSLTKLRTGKITGIKIKSNMNKTDLTAVNKALDQFLKSSTSTTKGLNKVMEKTKKSMYETLKARDKNITKEDIETYYNMLGDKDFDYFNDKIGASTMWALIEDSIEKEENQDEFLKRLNNYITLNDEDVKAKAMRLYEKYVL